MLFRDYIHLLYQAYLEDRGYLQKLRDRIKSEEFTKDQMYDPEFQDWESINPSDPNTYQRNRIKYHPNAYDPQQGVYTYESGGEARDILTIIKECYQRRKRHDSN
jgi:hypothetical protein